MLIRLIFLVFFVSKFISVLTFSQGKSVLSPYKINNTSGIQITLGIGTPPQQITKWIDQCREYTWTSTLFYDTAQSSSYSLKEGLGIYFDTEAQINALPTTEILTFTNNVTLHNFLFYLANNGRPYFFKSDGFGFAKTFNDTKLSLLHQWKSENIIEDWTYGFIPKNTTGGDIFFGKIDENIIKGKKQSLIMTNTSLPTWSGRILGAEINNNQNWNARQYISQDELFTFQSAFSNIYVPFAFMRFWEINLFLPYFKNETCEYWDSNNFQDIICSCDLINFMSDFSIRIDSAVLRLNTSKLFKPYSKLLNRCSLNINIKSKYDSHWILGAPFIHQFISEFDYEKSEIRLYGNNIISYHKGTYFSIVTILMISCLLALGLWILIYAKNKINGFLSVKTVVRDSYLFISEFKYKTMTNLDSEGISDKIRVLRY